MSVMLVVKYSEIDQNNKKDSNYAQCKPHVFKDAANVILFLHVHVILTVQAWRRFEYVY